MNLPPIVYSRAFWQSLSVLIAAIAVQLGWIVFTDAVLIEAAFLAILRLFDIIPELRVRGLIK